MTDRKMMLRLINEVKKYGDQYLTIEQRVGLLEILNSYLDKMHKSHKEEELIAVHESIRVLTNTPKGKA